MTNTPNKTPPARAWRFPLAMGLAIGIGMSVARNVEQALGLGLGSWAKMAISAASAGLIAGTVALVVYWLFEPVGSGNAEGTGQPARVLKDLPG